MQTTLTDKSIQHMASKSLVFFIDVNVGINCKTVDINFTSEWTQPFELLGQRGATKFSSDVDGLLKLKLALTVLGPLCCTSVTFKCCVGRRRAQRLSQFPFLLRRINVIWNQRHTAEGSNRLQCILLDLLRSS